MSEPDDRLDRAYRSLAREEPPASLDAQILAAARRAVARPSLARRWGVAVSMAALLVLAVGVVLEMQYEEPGIETSAPKAPVSVPAENSPRQEPASGSIQSAAPAASPEVRAQPESKPALAVPLKPAEKKAKREAPATHEAPAMREAPQAFPAAPAPVQSQGNLVQQAPRAQSAPVPQRESRAAATPPGAASAPMPAAPAAAEERFAAPAASMPKRSATTGGAAADRMTATTSPAAELEKIAKLREAGRDAEADRALEEFRKRYPDYRIDDAMWQRVKPRTSESPASPR